MAEDNSIFIGNKPFMNYVTGVVMQFTTKGAQEVRIKARGKFISRAVDVAEVSSKRFLDETVQVRDILINSEGFQNREGRDVRVSTIEIILARKDGMEPRVSQPIRRLERMNQTQSQSSKQQGYDESSMSDADMSQTGGDLSGQDLDADMDTNVDVGGDDMADEEAM